MTVAQIDVARSLVNDYDDAHFNAFQNQNLFRSQNIRVGNIFLGVQGGMVMRFAGLGIPKTATILSAFVDLTASGGFLLNPHTANFLGLSQVAGQAWKPPSFTGWRPDAWGIFKAKVRDPASALIVDTVPGAAVTGWAPRFEVQPNRDRVGMLFTVPAGPSVTLGEILPSLGRVGVPIGNITVDVVNVVGGLPDESTILATSDPVVAATIPAAQHDELLTFSGANQITLTGGTTYALIVRVAYAADGVNYINVFQLRQFIGPGGARHFADPANGFDYVNYPGVVDLFFIPTVGVIIPWVVPPTVAGTLVTSPNLAALVQSQLAEVGYVDGDTVGFRLTGGGGLNFRQFASTTHATLAAGLVRVAFTVPVPDDAIVIDDNAMAIADTFVITIADALAVVDKAAARYCHPAGARILDVAPSANILSVPDDRSQLDVEPSANILTNPPPS